MFPAISIELILKFISSPIGKALGAGLIVLTAYGAGDIRGRRIEHVKWEAAVEKAKAEAKAQDERAAENARKEAAETITQLADEKGKSDARIAELEQQLRARPADAPCLYGPNGEPAPVGVRKPAGAAAARPRNPGPTVLPSAR